MIDFSALQALDKRSGTSDTPSAAPQRSLELQALSNENRRRLENAEIVYAKYQENILKSDSLQCEINKGLKAGEDIYALFLKATKAISLMTGDTAFYDVSKKDLLAIYGTGLENPSVLQIELTETQTRLNKLKQAVDYAQGEDELSRIKTAIVFHEKAAKQIKEKIENANFSKGQTA